jgi:hypothetical protein
LVDFGEIYVNTQGKEKQSEKTRNFALCSREENKTVAK